MENTYLENQQNKTNISISLHAAKVSNISMYNK